MRSCESCAHFMALHNQCRAHAPKAFVVGVNQVTGEPAVLSVFAPTRPENWCGEYQPGVIQGAN